MTSPPENENGARQGAAFKTDYPGLNVAQNGRLSQPWFGERAPHRGWFRVEEEAVRRIETGLPTDGEIRFALVAYLTLCRKANLKQTDEFEDGMRSMARDMAASTRDAQRALASLKDLRLLEVTSQKVEGTQCSARNRYRLLRCVPNENTGCGPIENTCRKGSLLNTAHPFTQEVPQEPLKNHPKREASPPPFTSEAFLKAWSDWQEHLKQKRVKTTVKATQGQLRKCQKIGEQRAIAALENSIACNYQGIFEERSGRSGYAAPQEFSSVSDKWSESK